MIHKFTEEQISFLRMKYSTLSRKKLAAAFNRHFKMNLKTTQIVSCLKNHKIKSGRTGHFARGYIPASKGKKSISYPGMKATQFKKGNMPLNHRAVGSEKTYTDGYVKIKVSEPNEWRAKHV